MGVMLALSASSLLVFLNSFMPCKEVRTAMTEPTKNLCAQIPASLHAQVREQQEMSGKTLGQYMT